MRRNNLQHSLISDHSQVLAAYPHYNIWLASNKRRELAGLNALILYNPDHMSREVNLEALGIPTLAEAY
jgi:hypothetical protein